MASRVLMVAWDAGDPDLIDRWTTDGTLPHLAALRRAGLSGSLNSSAEYLAGSPWPTFYTGQSPSRHGIYHDFQWRHETMAFTAPERHWLDASPFWRHLEGDVPVVAYDVPMNLGVEPFNGVEVSGWAAHDKLVPPATYPTPLLGEIERQFGAWHIGPEQYGPAPVAELLALRDQLVEGVGRSADLALWLMQRPWKLAIVAFGALHRGGHRLFDRSSIVGPVTGADGDRFDRGLRDLYVACDAALGRLIAAAPDATVIAFSVHGMMANTSRVDLLDDMLARVLAGGADGRVSHGPLRRMGERIPLEWRRALTARVAPVHDERQRAIGVGRSEQPAHGPSFRDTEERRAPRPNGVQDRPDVAHPLLEAGKRPIACPIGEARAPLIEEDEAGEGRQAREEPCVRGLVPVQLDVRDPARHVDEIRRTGPHHLIRDMGFATFREPRLRPSHFAPSG